MRVHVLKPKFTYSVVKDNPQYETLNIRNRHCLVHRLVAAAFLGPRPSDRIVHHKDHNKQNNRPENLEYVTPSQNTLLAYAEGRMGRTVKLTAFQRATIAKMYAMGTYHSRQLAEIFHVSRSTILRCVLRAGISPHKHKKLTPKQYQEIRNEWIPRKNPASALARKYGVSTRMIEIILGMRASRGKRFTQPPQGFGDPTALANPLGTGLYQRRVPNHTTEEVGDDVRRID